MSIQIEYKGLWQKMPISKEECQIFIEEICTLHDIKNISLEIIICNDKESRLLNLEHLKANSPTNILSFPSQIFSLASLKGLTQFIENTFVGSLVLSIDTLEREAFLYYQDKSQYAKDLLLHGFAHLIGFDHGEEMDYFCGSIEKI